MDFDSLIYPSRTVISSSVDPATGPDETSSDSSRLNAADVWNYLLTLTSDPSSTKISSNVKEYYEASIGTPGNLIYFPTSAFNISENTPRLGEGACYRVYKYTLQPDGKAVAIKRLKIFPGYNGRSENSVSVHDSIATILKEVHILTHRPLQYHPNIVTLLGYMSNIVTLASESDQLGPHAEISLVAEFAPYGTLKDFFSIHRNTDGALDLITKAKFAHDVASGLKALHQCRIVQGDVKAENTLVFDDPRGDGGWVAKLSDFGHAIVGVDTSDGVDTTRYLGTTVLNAPEVRDKSVLVERKAFFRCDMFSYGLLLWELLLEGKRFLKELASGEGRDNDEPVVWLNSLPKDDLLRMALKTLNEKTASIKSNKGLATVLRRVLEATLRDHPGERNTMEEIVEIFREQRVFRDDARARSRITKRMVMIESANLPPLKPHALKKWSLEGTETTLLHFPPAIKKDILSQLESSTTAKTAISSALRRGALYDLAIGHLTGLGLDEPKADVDKALSLLLEAALLGSNKAQLICFRLHNALSRKIPQALLDLDCPAIDLEKELHLLAEPETYFAERVRRFEILYQQQVLEQRFDIYNGSDLVETGVFLDDIYDLIQEEEKLELSALRCVSNATGDDQSYAVNGLLLHIAARFGVLPLMEFLLSQAEKETDINIKCTGSSLGETALVAAAHGGHLPIVELLLSKNAETMARDSNALHWLIMFTPDEADKVLRQFLGDPTRKKCLEQIGDAKIEPLTSLSGTPLEFAISVNNTNVVNLLLAAKDASPVAKNRKGGPGWTGLTFGLAVESHLHNLIPLLIPHEVAYRRSLDLYPEVSRLRLSQGKRDLPPFGLFYIGRIPSALLLALIHGQSNLSALKATIDGILESGSCSINEEDEHGCTALTYAVRYAPCDYNTDILEALIARHARFGSKQDPIAIIHRFIAPRNDRAIGSIVRLLLANNLLPLNTNLVAASVQTTDARIVEAFFTFGGDGAVNVNTPLVQEGVSIPLLHIATMTLGSSNVVRLLINQGADLDALTEQRTALELAIMIPQADGETIDALVSSGASLKSELNLTIVHAATYAKVVSRVNGAHVLFHLLQHKRVREIVTSKEYVAPELSPLYLACLGGDLEAIYALLEAEIPVTWGIMEVLLWVGRHPERNPKWEDSEEAREDSYLWRLKVEKMILLLRDRWDPDHGRSPLHVAAEVLNYRRVVELVERYGANIEAADREGVTPLGLLEDVDVLEGKGADKAYIDSVKQMKDYLTPVKRLVTSGTINGTPPNGTPNRTPSNQTTPTPNGSGLEKSLQILSIQEAVPGEKHQDRLDIEADMRQIQLKDDAEANNRSSIIRNGRDSPEELEAKYSKAVADLKDTAGDTHPKTLSAMNKLYEIYVMLGRLADAEVLMYYVLREREARLTQQDPDLYGSWNDRIRILCGLGRATEAKPFAISAVKASLENFDSSHHVCLEASHDLALVQSRTGELNKAIGLLTNLIEAYQELAMTMRGSYFQVLTSLMSAYLQLGRFEAAVDLIRDSAAILELVQESDFLEAVDSVVDGMAGLLDEYLLWEVSEPLYLKAVELCLRLRGRRAYCTRTAMQKFATHYRKRGMWKEAGEVLEQLQVVLRVTFKASSIETLSGMLDLAEAYEMQSRNSEANILLQQVVETLGQNLGAGGRDHIEIIRAKAALAANWRKQALPQLEQAEQAGWEAVHGYRRLLGDDDDLTMKAETELALTLAAREKYAEAVALHEQVLETTVRVYGEVHDKTRNALERLTTTMVRQRRLDEADRLLERQLAIATSGWGEHSSAVAHVLLIQSTVATLRGDSQTAVGLLTRATEIDRAVTGGTHTSETLYGLRKLAGEHLKLEHWTQAAAILRSMLAEAPAIYGAGAHAETMLATAHLSWACENLGLAQQALEHASSALAMARELHGDWHADTVALMGSFVRLAPPTAALAVAREALTYNREVLGDRHPNTLESLQQLAALYGQLHIWAQSELHHRELWTALTTPAPVSTSPSPPSSSSPSSPPPPPPPPSPPPPPLSSSSSSSSPSSSSAPLPPSSSSPSSSSPSSSSSFSTLPRVCATTIPIITALATALSAQHLHAEALSLANAVCAHQTRALGETHPSTLDATLHLARLLLAGADYSTAEAVLLPLTLTPGHAAPARLVLARVFLTSGQLSDAERLLTAAAGGDEGKRMLASVYTKQKRYSLAERLLLSLPWQSDTKIKAQLVSVYSATKRWGEARALAEQVVAASDGDEEGGEGNAGGGGGEEDMVAALTALKRVYEGLEEETEVADVGKRIKLAKEGHRRRGGAEGVVRGVMGGHGAGGNGRIKRGMGEVERISEGDSGDEADTE